MRSVCVRVSPSLALIKYWGKADERENLPATSSLAVTLDGLYTRTEMCLGDVDRVAIGGVEAPIGRYQRFFDRVRESTGRELYFEAESASNFPTAAGLASSSSGFAALAYGCAQLAAPETSLEEVSAWARLGSASAARAVYEGFTVLPRESKAAQPLFAADHWPDLRILVAVVQSAPKAVGSRGAMERARTSSPFYQRWVEESEELFQRAIEACGNCDLKALGPLMRQSYLQMFSTMFTSSPPLIYWEPESLAVIKLCEVMRSEGLGVWETLDAGPQVKMCCLEKEVPAILERLQRGVPSVAFLVSKPGFGPIIEPTEGELGW